MKPWKQIRRQLRSPLESGAFALLGLIIPLLPRRAILSISNGMGRLSMHLLRRERSYAEKNLDAVFGDTLSPDEKRRIQQSSFATFCRTMLDVFWFSRAPEKRIPKYVTFEESPEKEAFFEDRPIICITAHMGSWEVLGQTCALMGADLASIAATVKNLSVDRMLIRQRQRTGQTIIPQKGALKTLIARFRRNGKAAFVLDQNTAEKKGGIIADFLGLPMRVSSAPAALAYRTGTEIMLGFCLPEPGGRYRICIAGRIQPPAYDKNLDQDAVIQELTQQIMDKVAAQIRQYPQYWLWAYKHWRRDPGTSYPDHYPHY